MCMAKSFFSRIMEAQFATGATHDIRIFMGSAAVAELSPKRPNAHAPTSANFRKRMISSQFRRACALYGKLLVANGEDCRRSNRFWQVRDGASNTRYPVHRSVSPVRALRRPECNG